MRQDPARFRESMDSVMMCLVRMESPGLTILPFHRMLVGAGARAASSSGSRRRSTVEERPLPADRASWTGAVQELLGGGGGTVFGLYRGGAARHAAAAEGRVRLRAAPAAGDLAAGRGAGRDGAAPGDLRGPARSRRAAPRAGGRHPLLPEGGGRGGGGRGRPRGGGVLPAAEPDGPGLADRDGRRSGCRRSRRTSTPSSSPASSSTSCSRNRPGRSRALFRPGGVAPRCLCGGHQAASARPDPRLAGRNPAPGAPFGRHRRPIPDNAVRNPRLVGRGTRSHEAGATPRLDSGEGRGIG